MIRLLLVISLLLTVSTNVFSADKVKHLYQVVIDRSHGVRVSDQAEHARYEKAFLNYVFNEFKRSKNSAFMVVGILEGEELFFSNTRILNDDVNPDDLKKTRLEELIDIIEVLDHVDGFGDDQRFKIPTDFGAVFENIKINEDSFSDITESSRIFIFSPLLNTKGIKIQSGTMEEVIDANVNATFNNAFKHTVIPLSPKYEERRTTEIFWAEKAMVSVAKSAWSRVNNGTIRISNITRTKDTLSDALPPESE